MKDELGGKIMIEFVALRPKTYAYLMDDDSEAKKAKGTKTCVSSDDDKRLQTYDRIASYPYRTSARKVCKTEMLSKVIIK